MLSAEKTMQKDSKKTLKDIKKKLNSRQEVKSREEMLTDFVENYDEEKLVNPDNYTYPGIQAIN